MLFPSCVCTLCLFFFFFCISATQKFLSGNMLASYNNHSLNSDTYALPILFLNPACNIAVTHFIMDFVSYGVNDLFPIQIKHTKIRWLFFHLIFLKVIFNISFLDLPVDGNHYWTCKVPQKWVRKKVKLRGIEKDHLWKWNKICSTFTFEAWDAFTFRLHRYFFLIRCEKTKTTTRVVEHWNRLPRRKLHSWRQSKFEQSLEQPLLIQPALSQQLNQTTKDYWTIIFISFL